MNREFTFLLDEDSKLPISYSESQKMQSKQLVEEYMLLANILIAKYLFKYCNDKTLLRIHEDIEADKKDKLSSFFKLIG
jgi:exoribonuclease R